MPLLPADWPSRGHRLIGPLSDFSRSDPEWHVQAAPVRATLEREPQERFPQPAGAAVLAREEGTKFMSRYLQIKSARAPVKIGS